MRSRAAFSIPLALCLGTSLTAAAAAAEVMAVLSSRLGPYQESFRGFEGALGRPVRRVQLPDDKPAAGPALKAVVAFGGKAASASYPDHVALVYCMAPGTEVAPGKRKGPSVRVNMLPPPARILTSLREVQPGLKRLAVLWITDGTAGYVEDMSKSASAVGAEILSVRLRGLDELPARLRAVLKGGLDAIWLPPDPLLVNPESFSIVRSFAWSNRLPFYVSSEGLVEMGAVASISSSYEEIGRTAARATLDALQGRASTSEYYPEDCEVRINVKAAMKCGLRVPLEVVRRATVVDP